MDLIVHDTLVKLTCDYFESNEIEASKRIVYECDAVTSLELHPIRRRNGPNKDKNNIEDVLYVLHKCPTSPGYIRFDPKKICNRMSVTLIICVKYFYTTY